MSQTASKDQGDDAYAPIVRRALRRFQAAWHAASNLRPDISAYLPNDPQSRPEVLLALARADLALRFRAGEVLGLEWYRGRFPELTGDDLTALIYEEFCLREEAGQVPSKGEYLERFPELADLLGPIFEIHGLFGSTTVSLKRSSISHKGGLRFPSEGQTIAGFRLVEELGRGAFARVFRAEERRLADRPVALKVTRTASREPQTLARLQHTHIVPIYSYRTDPVTGLHLLCMPYLGRVTLGGLLEDPALRAARTGADLLTALDRLDPLDASRNGRSPARTILAKRSYVQSIAWWVARLAEALQHAHDRGVWHGDIKPSNVLISDDGFPMLLDFNLAQEARLNEADDTTALGGTMAYMAPEQLEALASGRSEHSQGRSDIFALGVVLYEALVPGHRPFSVPATTRTIQRALLDAARERRAGAPWLRDVRSDVPAALAAVVERSLAPQPENRYTRAAELAADLQAVADDAPLVYAQEPIRDRSVRWLRRNRRRLAVLVPLVLAVLVAGLTLVQAELANLRLEATVNDKIREGRKYVENDRLDLAINEFETASHLAVGSRRLQALQLESQKLSRRTQKTKAVRDKVDRLLTMSDRLKFPLLGFSNNPHSAARAVEDALGRFDVPRDVDWQNHQDLELLDPRRRARLDDEVNHLLFLWVVALDRDRPGIAETSMRALAICDAALTFVKPTEPWLALRARYLPRNAERQRLDPRSELPGQAVSARACFQWGVLAFLRGEPELANAWLERSTRLQPNDYWAQFYLGYRCDRSGQFQKALECYRAAIALRPDSPWAYYNRGRLLRIQGAIEQAREDLKLAIEKARGFDFYEARLEYGCVLDRLGDAASARGAFDAVIASGLPHLARAARLDRAKLEIQAGAVSKARAEYDALLSEAPQDPEARLGRALLALRQGEAGPAEADLSRLIVDDPKAGADVFAHRSLARLLLGKTTEAEADAALAWRRRAAPCHERLRIRIFLALVREQELDGLTDPDEIDLLPLGGPRLKDDLQRTIERLGRRAHGQGPDSARAHRTLAVLLSALHDPRAGVEASKAVNLAPSSAEALRVRARVRRRSGDLPGALVDVEHALEVEPDDARSLTLRALLTLEQGRPAVALRDLDRAISRGASGPVHSIRALTFMRLQRPELALDEWAFALANDPEDPRIYLGRAQLFLQEKEWDRACADLEEAADWAGDRASLLARIVPTYARCATHRLPRLPRAFALGVRAWHAWSSEVHRQSTRLASPRI